VDLVKDPVLEGSLTRSTTPVIDLAFLSSLSILDSRGIQVTAVRMRSELLTPKTVCKSSVENSRSIGDSLSIDSASEP